MLRLGPLISACMRTRSCADPSPCLVELTDEQHDALHALLRRHATPQQIALRARIILAAAEGQSNTRIAQACAVTLDTVRLWRERWMAFQPIPLAELSIEDRLRDAPRAGKTPTDHGRADLRRSSPWPARPPSQSGRPITHWTNREIADEIIKRGIVDRHLPSPCGEDFKKPGTSNRIWSGPG